MMTGSGTAHLRTDDGALLRAENLVVEFGHKGRRVHAVSNVSLDIRPGETLGLVGESGCGKSTTGRAVALIQPLTSGKVMVDGRDMTHASKEDLRQSRTKVQMVFQDPISSLNPRRRIVDSVIEPLAVWGVGSKSERRSKAEDTLESVGIDPSYVAGRRPGELSGGQCQRVSIARALMLEPQLLICDEPVSSLDVSVQAQILNLLHDLKDRRGLTMLFIAHDLAVVKIVSDRVAVMYLGKLCELADAQTLYRRPAHPYTAALLESVPEPDPSAQLEAPPLEGDLPSPTDPPSGCRFRTRCPRAQQRCSDEEPFMRELEPGQFVACHFPLGPDEALDSSNGYNALRAEVPVAPGGPLPGQSATPTFEATMQGPPPTALPGSAVPGATAPPGEARLPGAQSGWVEPNKA
jgi:peptide/nickel transport system ATP-binding protein